MIIAIDFDGTIATPDCYPDIGEPNWPVIWKLRECHKAGDEIIVWTCRHGEHLERMKHWLESLQVPYDLINENDPERVTRFGADCRKLGADLYIDDKAVRPEEWVRAC